MERIKDSTLAETATATDNSVYPETQPGFCSTKMGIVVFSKRLFYLQMTVWNLEIRANPFLKQTNR